MIDIDCEDMMSLGCVSDWIHRKVDRRLSRATVYNWVSRGVRGKRLEVVRVGGLLYTSVEALNRFFAGDVVEDGLSSGHNRENSAVMRRAEEVFG